MSAARGGLEPLVLPFLAPRLLWQQCRAASSLVASTCTASSPAAVPRTRAAARRTAATQAQVKHRGDVDWTHDSSRWERFGPLQQQQQPVASTSAVRVDAIPTPSPAPSTSSSSGSASAPSPASPPPPCLSDESLSNQKSIDALVAELEPALERLRAAYLASPSSSPLHLVRSTLSALEHVAAPSEPHTNHNYQSPPIPPPLIRLDPQPHAGPNSRLWTPFLLQALFLGASALGLLARRKVNQHALSGVGEGGGLATERGGRGMREAQRARQEAEDRIDQVQALNLLVVALGRPDLSTASAASTSPRRKEHPPALAPAPAPGERWHDELAAAKNLAGLLHRVERDRIPFDHFTVLAALRVVATAADAAESSRDKGVQVYRRAIGLWAWRAVQPTVSTTSATSDLSSAEDAGKAAITRAFLSLLYPSFEASQRHFFPRSTSSHLTDRHILNSLSERILLAPASGTTRTNHPNPNPVLVRELAETAWRARRVDILGRIATTQEGEVDASVRLLATSRALELLTMDAQRRRKAEIVLPWAAAFVDSVKALAAGVTTTNNNKDSREWMLPGDLELVRAGLSCLTRDRAFAINRPLAPFVAETCLALLRNPILATQPVVVVADKKSATNLVERAMRHLVRSRSPRLAEEVFQAIPHDLVSLQHYRILLSSDHAPLANRAWTRLIEHPTLRPDAATVRAALVPTAQSPDRTALSRAFRLFRRLEKPTSRDWTLLLSVVSRHGSDRLLARVRREMAAAGSVADRYTAAALVSREMHKTDVQKRTLVDRQGPDLDSDSDSLRATRRAVEQLRRVSGTAQIRRVRLAAREWDAKSSSSVLSRRANEQAEDILPNLLLKNAARWPKEYGVKKLVLLARAQLGVDLQEKKGGAAPNVNLPAAARNTSAAVPPTWRHFEQVRRPAFRTLAKALEKRGRADLASELRRVMREEEARVQRQERRARRDSSAVHL